MDLAEAWPIFGPGVAGIVFGAGWWFWIDAVVCSSVAVSFVHYLPGIFASIAAVMFNCVRREDIDYSPYDEGEWSDNVLGGKLQVAGLVCQVEALAFLCLCCIIRLSSSLSWPINTRFTCEDWSFILDRNCRCLAVRVCVDQWTDLLDFTFGLNCVDRIPSITFRLELQIADEDREYHLAEKQH